MPDTIMPKLYRVYFENNEPLFAEFYSNKTSELYPIDFFGKRLVSNEIYSFVIVLARDEDDALVKAKDNIEV